MSSSQTRVAFAARACLADIPATMIASACASWSGKVIVRVTAAIRMTHRQDQRSKNHVLQAPANAKGNVHHASMLNNPSP